MATSAVDEELWDDFHRAVNMTSRELEDWLRQVGSGAETEALPDQAGPELGQHVLGILRRRGTDLSEDDAAAMRRVVDIVRRERGDEPEPTAGDDAWRGGLMAIGHDPLKPEGSATP